MSHALSVILFIMRILHGSVLDTCKYVQPEDYRPTYAVDVCRTHVTAGTIEYRKYVCDAGAIKDEIWDTNTCDVTLTDTTTPSSLVRFNCENYGDCEYFMLAYYDSGFDCGDNTYTIQPVISGACIVVDHPNVDPHESYYFTCADKSIHHEQGDGACPSHMDSVETVENCGSLSSIRPYLNTWGAESGCQNISYASESPTQVPSTSPTKQPSADPTAATAMPSENPSEMPSDVPTQAPSDVPGLQPIINGIIGVFIFLAI
eukprot:243173_1